jgi:hypothetical protein
MDDGIQEIQLGEKGTLNYIKGSEMTAYPQASPFHWKDPRDISQFLAKIFDRQRHHIVRQKAREKDDQRNQKEGNPATMAE